METEQATLMHQRQHLSEIIDANSRAARVRTDVLDTRNPPEESLRRSCAPLPPAGDGGGRGPRSPWQGRLTTFAGEQWHDSPAQGAAMYTVREAC